MIKSYIINSLADNEKRYADIYSDEAQQLLDTLIYKWAWNSDISAPFHMDKYSSHQQFDNLIYVLSKKGFITSESSPSKKWGKVEINNNSLLNNFSADELLTIRKDMKFRKYIQRTKVIDRPDNLVRLPKSGVVESGIARPGLARTAKLEYKFDTAYIAKYYDAIHTNLVKSMHKMADKGSIFEDKANYAEICTDVLNYHIFHSDTSFNSGFNVSDSRGRAIFDVMGKAFNWISNKDARSLLVVPEAQVITTDDIDAIDNIYLFIAELVGTKASSWEEKKLIGADCYATRDIHTLDLTNEDDLKELHENIWVERIYSKLDILFEQGYVSWDIVLEADFTGSLLAIQGCLLNDEQMLDQTNCIYPDSLKDIWTVDGVPRNMVKAKFTPACYGSSETTRALLAHRGFKATKEQFKALRAAEKNGALALATQFKDAVIDNCQMEPTMKVKIWNEEFTIECNKYRTVGSELKAYTLYDTEADKQRTFLNMSTVKVSDLDRFKLFAQTLLCHNLDSQIMDYIIQPEHIWCLPIYDAVLALPKDITELRTRAVCKLEQLRKDGRQIITDFRKSLNITGDKADLAFAKLYANVQTTPTDVKLSTSCMK